MSRDTFHYPPLLQAPSSLALDTARAPGAATASLSTLCQGLSTLTGKNFFPISNLKLFSVQLLDPECPASAADGQLGTNPELWLKPCPHLHGSAAVGRRGVLSRDLEPAAAEGRALARAARGRYRPRRTAPPGGAGTRRPPLTPPFDIGRGRSGRTPGAAGAPGMKMSCTIEKALADAKALVERLREHDSAAEALIEQTTALNKRVEAMKQYQEEIQELNEVARHRPRSTLVMGIQQENRQIRELQQENKELRTSLEEHQSALELIMSKYREQMFRLLMASKKDDPSIIMKLKEQHSKELQVHVDQITEMAAVMRKAIEVDERHGCKEQERITQLEQENKGLREILQITRESFLNLKKDDASESTSLSGLVTSSDLSLRKS